MDRRALLGVLAAGMSAGAAGCIGGGGGGGGDGGDDATTETTATTTTTPPTTATTTESPATTAGTATPEAAVRNGIETTRELLRVTLSGLSPSPTPTEGQQSMTSFEAEVYRERFAAVRSSLDAAESAGPSDQQRETIERLRVVVDFVEAYVDFLVPVRRATESFLAADEARIAGEYGAALESLGATRSRLEEARSRLETVRSHSSEVGQYLEVGSAPYGGALQDLRGEPSEWDRRFAVFSLLVEGGTRLVNALQDYRSGVEAYGNGEYGAAADAFATAETAADEARTRFEEVSQRSLVTNIGTDTPVLACRARAVRAAANNYADAADAAGAGEEGAAESSRRMAEDAFGRDC